MDEFGTISSIDSLPLPDGRHVKDFDAAQATAKKAARAAKNVAATGTPPQAEVIVAPPIPGSEPETAKQPQALESNASESQSLVPDTTITGEYVENTQSLQRNVEPISRAVLSSPGTTMQELHEMATHELDVTEKFQRKISKKCQPTIEMSPLVPYLNGFEKEGRIG